MFSKDTVKEHLLDQIGFADRDASRRIGAASGELLWTLLRDCATPALIESWLAPSTREIVRAGLARASVDRVIEVWCSCPPEVTRRRFMSRERHPGHFDADLMPELDVILSGAEPLGLGDVVHVATQAPVDIPALSSVVLELIRSPSRTSLGERPAGIPDST